MNDAIDGLSPLVATEVIVPFFVEAALQSSSASNFTVLRVLRLTRLFRLVKLGKSFEVLQIIGRVFHKVHCHVLGFRGELFFGHVLLSCDDLLRGRWRMGSRRDELDTNWS